MPYFDVVFDAKLHGSAGTVVTGDILTLSSDGTTYVKATAANLIAGHFPSAIVVESFPGDNTVIIQFSGNAPASVTGLAAGAGAYVRLNTTTARMERLTVDPVATDWLVGRAFPTGAALLVFNGVQGPVVGDSGGVQVIVDIRDYGAVCDGVTDDSPAWDAALADVPVLGIDVIEVPKTAGGCAISRPIRMCSTDGAYLMNGVTIRGQLDTPAVAPALTYLVWLGDRRSGSAASMTASAGDVEPGADYLSVTWTHFLLSGCTGANFTAADVGTTGVRISGAADTTLNCQARITKYVSATSVYVAIPNQAAMSDANNGSISWLVLDSMIYMQGRALAVENLSPFIPTGKYVYNYLSYTHPTGESNQLSVSECSGRRIRPATSGTGVIENLLEIGQWIVPTKSGFAYTFQTAANGQYRPWSPYQCDFFTLENAINEGMGTTYDGACIRSANASGQSRGNVGRNIGSLSKEYITLERSDFPNSNFGASSTWLLDNPIGGGISVACFGRTTGQAQMVIRDVHWEVGTALLKTYGLANSSTSTMFVGGYLNLSSTPPNAVDPVGLFQISDGSTLTVVGMPLEMLNVVNNGGYLLDAPNVGHAAVSFIGCTLPDPEYVYGKKTLREIFNLRGQYCQVNISSCNAYKEGVGIVALGDMKFAGGAYAAGAGIHTEDRFGSSFLMRGTSNSLFTAMNYFGVVTISGTETRKTWVFTDPEIDEDYSDHYYEVLPTLLSTSGTVAATCLPKRVETSRRSCTLEMAAAPGAGTSVTYGLRLIRHNQAPTTAFHPQDITNLYFYFDAEYDMGYNVAISPELQDNATGRLYWRSQAPRRAAAYANTSAYDPYARTSGGTDDPSYLPTTAVDAAFNNKTVATFTPGKALGASLTGYEACATPYTIFVVGTAGTGTGDKIPFSIDDGVGNNANILNDGTNTYLQVAGVNINAAHAWSSPAVVCGVANGVTSALYLSAITAAVTGTVGAQATGADDYVIIGNNRNYNKPWSGGGGVATGKIAAILVYKGALSTADRTSVTNWLGTRYGITIAP